MDTPELNDILAEIQEMEVGQQGDSEDKIARPTLSGSPQQVSKGEACSSRPNYRLSCDQEDCFITLHKLLYKQQLA